PIARMALRHRGVLAPIAACGAFLLLATEASADGNEAHSERYRETATGLHIASAGVGLAGRRELGAPAVPTVSATIELETVPAGAIIEAAYLYWAVYGTEGDAELTLNGSNVTGTLIGTSDGTCWTTVAA